MAPLKGACCSPSLFMGARSCFAPKSAAAASTFTFLHLLVPCWQGLVNATCAPYPPTSYTGASGSPAVAEALLRASRLLMPAGVLLLCLAAATLGVLWRLVQQLVLLWPSSCLPLALPTRRCRAGRHLQAGTANGVWAPACKLRPCMAWATSAPFAPGPAPPHPAPASTYR